MSGPGNDLPTLLGFQIRDPSIFRSAFVHRSYCNEHGLDAAESYERLEFLGDAVLQLIISTNLYQRFPEADEGQLTKARSSIVRGTSLAGVARRLSLGERLLMGRGAEDLGERNRESVLAAALEALIGAIFLDRGLESATDFVDRHMAPEIAELSSSGDPPENPKSRLQEYLQGLGQPPPEYREAHREGPDHNPVFTIEVLVDDVVVGKGKGGKKSEAERAAAEAALESITTDSS